MSRTDITYVEAFRIEWDKFAVGASVFVPCINPQGAKRRIRAEADALGYRVVVIPAINSGRYGLRVIREL